jgi:hypothetical protein
MKKKPRKPGDVPPGKIGVYDRANKLRGHVGSKATSVTASRFTGQPGAVLTKGKSKGERDSWSFPK